MGLADLSNKLGNTFSNIQRSADSFGRVANSVNNASGAVNRLVGTNNSSSNASVVRTVPARTGNASGGMEGMMLSGQVTPLETCIYIDSRMSSTGQERYLGRNVYETIQNMMTGKETVAHAIVVDANGQPSANVYDRTADGYCLKGSGAPVKIKVEDGRMQGVLLSEKEYNACVKSMKTTDQSVRRFTHDDRLGSAEDANVHSWFQRNWGWLAGVAAAVTTVAITFFMQRSSKKKEKSANQTAQVLRSEVKALTDEVKDLTEKSNALAASSPALGSQITESEGAMFAPVALNSRD